MKKQAFSLAEALVTIFFVFTIFGFLAVLMQNYSTISAHTNLRDRALAGVQNAILSMRGDLEAALVVTPGPNTLTVKRVNPGKRGRLKASLGPPWKTAADTGFTMQVSYFINADQALVRSVTPSGGSASQFVLAQGISGFLVSDRSDANHLGLYEIALSFLESKQVRSVKTKVAMRVGFE